MALLIDPSSPAVATGATATVTTSSFTPPSGSVLLIEWAGNSVVSTNPAAPSITDNLGVPLTYTLLDWKSHADAPTRDGQAAMWVATVAGSAPMAVSVTNGAASAPEAALKVSVLTGANTITPIGVHGKAGSASAASIAQPYTAAASGGWGFLSVCDWDLVGPTTAGAGTTVDGSANLSSAITYTFARRTLADDAIGVSNTLNVTLPATSTHLAWVYAEVLPAAGAAPVAESWRRSRPTVGPVMRPGRPAFPRRRSFVETGTGASLTADAALAVTTTLTAGATADHPAAASLSATATLSATADRTAQVAASLTATATLTADAAVSGGSASLAATATLTAGANLTTAATAALAVTATLSATTTATRPSTASLSATASITAATSRTATVAASLPATATLTAAAALTAVTQAPLSVTATLAAAAAVGVPPITGTAALAVTATLTAAGARTASPTATLTVTTAITAGALAQRAAAAALAAFAALAAGGSGGRQAAAALVVTATLTATADVPDALVPRPFAGTIARPGAGAVARPGAGTVARAGSGVVARPSTGMVARP